VQRLSRLFTFAAAATAAAFTVPAGASAAGTATCTLEGLAHMSPGVLLIGGSGEYDFGANGGCRKDGGPPAPVDIESHGNFINIVCGTGTAFSRDPHLGDQGLSPDFTRITGAGIVNMSYHVEFRATQGILEIHTVDDGAGDEPEHLSPNGHVAITPSAGESCRDANGVNAFDVRGAFHASLVQVS
jgi:hypothetical protein